MYCRKYYYWLAVAPWEAQINLLREIPGIWVDPNQPRRISIPENAAWLVETFLAQMGLAAQCYEQPNPMPHFGPEAVAKIPGLRPFVPEFMRPFQIAGVAFAAERPGVLLWHPAGCLAGSTEVSLSRSDSHRRVTLEWLYRSFVQPETNSFAWTNLASKSNLTAWNGTKLVRQPIFRVVYSGIKETFRLILTTGHYLDATADHRIFTPEGEKPLSALSRGRDLVLAKTKQKGWSPVHPVEIAGVTYLGMQPTYDVSMMPPLHNFLANNIIVSNSGKTLSSIAWGLAKPGKILAITRSGVRKQWAKEVARYTTETAQVIEGEKPVALDPNARFIVIGWDILPAHREALIAQKFVSVIGDESHYRIRGKKRWNVVPVAPGQEQPGDREINGEIIRFEDADNIASAAAAISKATKRRLATSATPVADRLADLWGQLDFLEPHAFGNYRTFTTRYCEGHINPWGGWDAKGKSLINMEELQKRLSFLVHFVPYEVTHKELPPKRRLIQKISRDLLLKSSSITKGEWARAIKRGENGLGLIELKLADACSRKRPAVVDLVLESIGGEKSKGKVIVFTGRRADCTLVGDALRKKIGDRVQIWAASGDQTITERDRIKEAYMAHPGPCVLVGTIDAWGTGHNLHDTDVAICAMLPLTPERLIQMEGRTCIAAGQLVPTKRGAIPVEQVVVGDEVWTHKGRWRLVQGMRSLLAAHTNGKGFITEIEYMHHSPGLRCTSDHRLWVEPREGGEARWVEAQHVRPGDFLLLKRPTTVTSVDVVVLEFPEKLRTFAVHDDTKLSPDPRNVRRRVKHKVVNPRYRRFPDRIEVDANVAWLFGYYAGDGWARLSTTGGRYVGLAGNAENHKRECLARAIPICARWGLTPSTGWDKAKGNTKAIEIKFYSAEAAAWFAAMFGSGALNKRVPPQVFNWPASLINAFLEGYFDSDGHRRDIKDQDEWSTSSPHLALQIPLLLSMIGRVGSCKQHPNGDGRWKWVGTSKRVRDGEPAVRHVVRTVSHSQAKKDARGVRERVYDLDVEGDESFVVGLATVHNCRLGMKRPVLFYYLIAEGTIDEHYLDLLLDKLPAVESLSGDAEATKMKNDLCQKERQEEFINSVLEKLKLVVLEE
jgi:intein/homing endonuclease